MHFLRLTSTLNKRMHVLKSPSIYNMASEGSIDLESIDESTRRYGEELGQMLYWIFANRVQPDNSTTPAQASSMISELFSAQISEKNGGTIVA